MSPISLVPTCGIPVCYLYSVPHSYGVLRKPLRARSSKPHHRQTISRFRPEPRSGVPGGLSSQKEACGRRQLGWQDGPAKMLLGISLLLYKYLVLYSIQIVKHPASLCSKQCTPYVQACVPRCFLPCPLGVLLGPGSTLLSVFESRANRHYRG